MATTRAIVIGTGGDYASVSAFKADLSNLPSDLVAADEIWQVQFVNKGTEWDLGGGMGLEGLTTDDTHFVILEPQPGGSFLDLFGPTTPFRYYPDGLGVALDCNRDFNSNGLGLPGTSLVRRLMIRNSRFRGGIADGVRMEDCITWVRAQDAHNNVRATRVLAFQEETNDRHGFSLDGTATVDRYNDGVLYIQLGNGHQGVTQIRGGRVINSAYFAGTGDDVVSNAINTGNGFGEIDYSAMGDAAISGAGFDSVGPNMLYNVDITTAIENFSSDMTLMDARLSASSPLRGAGEGGIDIGPGWSFAPAVTDIQPADLQVSQQLDSTVISQVHSLAVASLSSEQLLDSAVVAEDGLGGPDFAVLRGSAVIPAGQTSLTLQEGVDFTLEPGIASTAWFAFISNTHFTGMGRTSGGGNQNADDFTVSLTHSGNDIVFNRAGSTNNCRVDWQILQYVGPAGGPNEFVVRNRSIIGFASSDITLSQPAGIVDQSKVVPWITGQRTTNTGAQNLHSALCTVALVGSALVFERGNASGTVTISFAVIEFTGSNWTVGNAAFSGTSSDYSFAIPPVSDVTETFLHCQYRYVAGVAAGLDDASIRVHLEAVNSLRINATTSTDLSSKFHSVWIISNPELVVERVLGIMAGVGEEEVDDISITQVPDLGEAFTTLSNNSTGSGTAMPRGYINHLLLDDSTVRLRQSDDGQTSEFALEVVQLPHSVGAPGAVQVLPESLVSSISLDPVTITQVHQLAVTSLDVAQILETSAFIQSHLLTIADLVLPTALDSTAISQVHQVAIADLVSASVLDTASFDQISAVLSSDLVAQQRLDETDLVQLHQVEPVDTTSLVTLEGTAFSQLHIVTPDDLVSSSALDSVSITTVAILSTSGLVSLQVLQGNQVFEDKIISPASLVQLSNLDEVIVTLLDLWQVQDAAGGTWLKQNPATGIWEIQPPSSQSWTLQ